MTGLRFLVVDDDAEFTASVEEILTNWGYRAVTAGTGAEAVSMALAERVDPLLLDLRFPDIEGADMYREIARMTDPPETAVITGYAKEECTQVMRLPDMDAESCPSKPLGPQKLVEPIERSMR